jgi:ubiquinone/menaquinone biosynthesis C-methylase UbiE
MSRKTSALPKRRYTDSRESYWQEMFNDIASLPDDYSASGWSKNGLFRRLECYVRALDGLHVPPGALVLDIGCGSGTYTRKLSELGFTVVGMDYALKAVVRAKQQDEQGSAYICGNVLSLPFADATFDHAVCIGLFQSLENTQAALVEIARVLKPEAPLALMTLNNRDLITKAKRLLGKEEVIVVNGASRPRLMTYDPADMAEQVKRAGFASIKTQPVQIYIMGYSLLDTLVGIWNTLPQAPYLTARSFLITAQRA